MSGLLGKSSPAKRVDGNNDLPMYYVNPMSVEPQGRPSDTTRVSVTFAEHLMNVEDARNDESASSRALGIASPINSAASSFNSWASAPASSISSSPFVLSFTDLTYSVKIQKKFNPLACCRRSGNDSSVNTKILLNGISGEAREGEMMAVLGASGSGKSTLIDALANRIAKDSLRGSITLNGEVLESSMQKVISAYVMQDDLLFPMLTVEETLMFSAEFRLPRSLSKKKKKARVQALIDQLGLRSAAKTVIGDEGHRGVSGGERRRVSIGNDIIHDPIILFLDEPTSGLDSTSAYMVIKVLQRIAQSGSIVIMSIHQPSYRIMGLLDQLIFLSKGNTVYSGSPTHLPQFFSEFKHPIPENENKTEFALDLIRELEYSTEGTKPLVEFHKQWRAKQAPSYNNNNKRNTNVSSLKEAITASISRGKLVSGATNNNSSNLTPSFQTFANPFWIEMIVIGKRAILNSRRQPELLGMRLGAVMVTGIILATMFTNLDNSPKGAQERLGFFAFAMSTTFYTCAEAIPVFLQERYIFMRETAYNAYRRSSYVLSQSIISIPALIVLSASFAATTFWAVGLDGGANGFFFFYFTILASFWAGSSFVTFLSGVIPNVMLGFTVVVAILAYFLLFSGFFISRDRIPVYWLWFHYISLVKYPYEGVLQNEFQNPTRCFARGVQLFDNSPLGEFPNDVKVNLLKSMSGVLGTNVTAETCVTTGIDILKQQGITDISKWNCLWITVAWGFFFRVLFYFTLLIGSKNKRK
ncbi:putative AAA+ ATPase domain, pigment precursor permease/Protein ATP-binding cassette sub-family G [Arabidopsis thaliana]|jgi:EPP (Eye Pigment Precursor) family transporter|uniref:ABC transporter G family member 2 n=4 Tax=Arabidopsis TaxID=3701 RepID=AB2G_ARATH|nr:ABC-2 type transporter family protein [Arabidopsis thaliana]Q9ZUT0.1 RecName: Full=ABC transporter G family member 2; Short=ABC transporter ABCG.2; Short=AtABCG2; AltName: Full=White-brown complex homolog protein 2; Short=AtWBC2 [Arabidopsis thaliana]KAG7638824.1 ABC-2 type transporter [Arabidopsis thaliana x Arabidopsis arenosa]KAG7643427.1 ABC-2 type transporter [Arabidopsis suecica]AAC98055.1 putative ABC transporter [Arabidopsis thaliana]AEC09388.1 ABC-2 type transporter family protein |eukprot:NP_181272.1 ABC-2 type transporter family protein [Arabidopsis thaliana]